MVLQEWELEELEEYKKLGYRWKVSWQGYSVWFEDEYIGGAGVSTTVGTSVRKPHWKRVQANVRDNYRYVLSTIRRDMDRRF